MTKGDLEGMGCALSFLKRKDLEKLKKAELCETIKNLEDCVEDMPEAFVSEQKKRNVTFLVSVSVPV